jgi:hypothetical protein
MKKSFRATLLAIIALPISAIPTIGQNRPPSLRQKIDVLIQAAYQSASAGFPCKAKTRGKAKVMHWEDVDRCLNAASDRVAWESLTQQLQDLGRESRVSWLELSAEVESSLSANALKYEKVFSVKDPRALLPLSNSVLKFLPPDSFQDFPVFDNKGKQVGTFAGVYLSDRSEVKLSIFQYTDPKGNMQTPAAAGNRLLLDSYGVPWTLAISQPGFRLPPENLTPKHQ